MPWLHTARFAPQSGRIGLFCLGLGYTAQALSARLKQRDIAVSGTVRTPEKAARLRSQGLDAWVWDGRGALPNLTFDADTIILVSVPPDEDGCPAARAFGQATAELRVVYLSTTGVYGDRGGDWVDETSEPTPSGARGERRRRAEQDWRAVTPHLAIARLPGIYGPGRNAIEGLQEGTARRIVKPGQCFSRIHVSDLASGLEALMDAGTPAGVYHFADDEPTPPEVPITYAAELLGLTPPALEDFDSATLSPMARSFYAESKRVSSCLTRERLGWRPRFSSYRDGLAAIYADLRTSTDTGV